MNTDPLAKNHSIVSGEIKKRTGTFSQTSLDGKSYVLHMEGINNSDGSNQATFGQFTFTTNGQATGVIDDNGNPENLVSATFTINTTTAPGRVTITSGGGTNPPIFYLVNSGLAFVADTSSSVASGLLEQQTGPFGTASISGPYFFGAAGPTTGSSDDSGAANFNAATAMITGTQDSSRSDGLQPNNPISNGGAGSVTYCFAPNTCTPATTATGQGNISGSLAYIISSSKVMFMDSGNQNGSTGPVNRRFLVIQK